MILTIGGIGLLGYGIYTYLQEKSGANDENVNRACSEEGAVDCLGSAYQYQCINGVWKKIGDCPCMEEGAMKCDGFTKLICRNGKWVEDNSLDIICGGECEYCAQAGCSPVPRFDSKEELDRHKAECHPLALTTFRRTWNPVDGPWNPKYGKEAQDYVAKDYVALMPADAKSGALILRYIFCRPMWVSTLSGTVTIIPPQIQPGQLYTNCEDAEGCEAWINIRYHNPVDNSWSHDNYKTRPGTPFSVNLNWGAGTYTASYSATISSPVDMIEFWGTIGGLSCPCWGCDQDEPKSVPTIKNITMELTFSPIADYDCTNEESGWVVYRGYRKYTR